MHQNLIDLMSLEGKVACITGAGEGIGRSIAWRLSEAGAALVVTDINAVALEETCAEIENQGGKAHAVCADARDVSAAGATIATAIEVCGRLDILVNNAAVFLPRRAIDVTENDWDRMMDVDLKGLFFHCQAAARHMIAAGEGGRIINIASISAHRPLGGFSVYEGAKGGVTVVTRSLAKEFGEFGITVNSVVPGSIVSPGTALAAAKWREMPAMASSSVSRPISVLGRRGQPTDVANAVLFLAGNLASYITGTALVVDGGYLLV